jgi:TPR repeat protein
MQEAAFRADDFQKAFRLFKSLAEQGYAKAPLIVAGMYFVGKDVHKDYAKAVYWYSKAAEQGHAGAQYNLDMI